MTELIFFSKIISFIWFKKNTQNKLTIYLFFLLNGSWQEKNFICCWYFHTQISPPAAFQCLGFLGRQHFYYCVLMSISRNTRVGDVSQHQLMGLFPVGSAPSGANDSSSSPLPGPSHCWALQEFCRWHQQQNKIQYKLPGLKYLGPYYLAKLAGH